MKFEGNAEDLVRLQNRQSSKRPQEMHFSIPFDYICIIIIVKAVTLKIIRAKRIGATSILKSGLWLTNYINSWAERGPAKTERKAVTKFIDRWWIANPLQLRSLHEEPWESDS